jgi:hypothetical protein
VNVLIICPEYGKILWIQNQANNRQLIGNDILQEIILEDIVRILFRSFKQHNVNRIKVEYLIHILFL